MARSFTLTAMVAVLLSGCGKSEPIVSGGKPAAYWVKASKDPNVSLRKQAVIKLGNIGTADEAALPALMEALRDREAAVRKEAILALLKCGPVARQALAPLNELRLRDPDPDVRAYAAKATKKLDKS